MKITCIQLQGFRSFSKGATLDLRRLPPGLYHVMGRNLAEPELGANGAGKSSLFEAVFWALYGKTSRNLRASTVKSWKSREQCGVILSLQTSSGDVNVLRTWKPNTLEVSENGKEVRPVDQQELERIIGITPEAFLFSIYFAQFAPSFVDVSPAEQTELFSSVLKLGLWEEASSRADSQAKTLTRQIQELRENSARLEGQAEELLSKNYREEEITWEQEYKKQLTKLEREESIASKSLRIEEKAWKYFSEAEEEIEAQIKKIRSIENNWDDLKRNADKLSTRDVSRCPTCGGPIDSSHVHRELLKTKKELSTLSKELEAEKIKLKKMRGALPERGPIDEARHEAAMASARVKSHKTMVNPYRKLREEQSTRSVHLSEQIEKAEKELVIAEKNHKTTEYWVKGFKEIRLSLIRDSLDQLTVEVNETLYQLGLRDWSIEFDVERENKSGGINRNFNILIKAPHVDELVPWGVWSGGESQRLRLAITMGFSNLISSRLGLQSNLEMYDEPSQWLSGSGIGELLSVLAERAKRQDKIILLADHRSLEFGGFSGLILVEKDLTHGSRIQVNAAEV